MSSPTERDDFQATEYESVDIIKAEPLQPSQGIGSDMLDEAGKKCWKGYKKAGTQKLFGKTYNRCVKAHFSDWRADMELKKQFLDMISIMMLWQQQKNLKAEKKLTH